MNWVPVELVDPEDGVVPPAGDEDVVLEDGDGVEVLDGGSAQDGPTVAAVKVRALDVVEVGVHPEDVPVRVVDGDAVRVHDLGAHHHLPLGSVLRARSE